MKNNLMRTNLNITRLEHEYIKKISEEKGLTMSEFVRRILDEYIKENENK
jgi:predicted DNA-binding protein